MRRWWVLAVASVALVPAANAPAQQQRTLALATSVSPSPAVRGKPVTFRLEVANRGSAEVRNVRLVLELDPADRLVATSVPCTVDGGAECPVGTLGSGAESEVRITLVPRTLEVSSRFATARSDEPGDAPMVLTELLVCTIVGTPRAEPLPGTAGDDFICGAGGHDRIDAGQGSDRIYGHGRILGGEGDDHVLVAGGDWQLNPGTGKADAFRGRSVVRLGPGNDRVRGLGGRELVFGGPGNDFAEGDNGDDRLLGQGGKDELHGQSGADAVHGGDGGDTLAGHRGDDLLTGGTGDDLVFGGYLNESNEVHSPGGNDRLLGGPGRDRVAGGKGRDHVDGGPGADELSGGSGNDVLLSADGWVDVVNGNLGSDRARVDSRDRVYRVERVSGR